MKEKNTVNGLVVCGVLLCRKKGENVKSTLKYLTAQ